MLYNDRCAIDGETPRDWCSRLGLLLPLLAVHCNTFDDPPQRSDVFLPSPAIKPVPNFPQQPVSTTAPPVVTQLTPIDSTVSPSTPTTASPTTWVGSSGTAFSTGETQGMDSSSAGVPLTSDGGDSPGAPDADVPDAGRDVSETLPTEVDSSNLSDAGRSSPAADAAPQ